MNDEELNEQCESFRGLLYQYEPLGVLQTGICIEFLSQNQFVLTTWVDEDGETLLYPLFWHLKHDLREKWPLPTFQGLVPPQTSQALGCYRRRMGSPVDGRFYTCLARTMILL